MNDVVQTLHEALSGAGHVDALSAILGHTLPAWTLALDPTPPAGRTRFFGDPDLPPSLPWPTHADCTMWDEAPELPADALCRFVCQLDLARLAGPGMPALEGLLSVFVYAEFDEVGTLGVVLHHFPPGTHLETRPHPQTCPHTTDMWANERLPPRSVVFRPIRTLPDSDGPWSADAEPLAEAWSIAAQVFDEPRSGLFGHLQATTGFDPSPSRQHRRLLVVPTDDEGVCFVHLAIHEEALAAGGFDQAELVWVDFDG